MTLRGSNALLLRQHSTWLKLQSPHYLMYTTLSCGIGSPRCHEKCQSTFGNEKNVSLGVSLQNLCSPAHEHVLRTRRYQPPVRSEYRAKTAASLYPSYHQRTEAVPRTAQSNGLHGSRYPLRRTPPYRLLRFLHHRHHLSRPSHQQYIQIQLLVFANI